MDWFARLTGFKEGSYAETRRKLSVAGGYLHSSVNGKRCATGSLETPLLGELRRRAQAIAAEPSGVLRVVNEWGDAGAMHADPDNSRALFQVASQFNLLEMVGPDIAPEDGVTRYVHDKTQGPACAIAAGAATIYRNYFAEVNGHSGQTRHRQIDCLAGLGPILGNQDETLWTMRNGYALCTHEGLAAINLRLAAMESAERSELRDSLRIGLHWNVEVTAAASTGHLVSQAFCAALPVSYTRIQAADYRPFASLILEGAYEATLWAAVLNAKQNGSATVFLTKLGGSAFGNAPDWITQALRYALQRVRGSALDVRLVSYQQPDPDLLKIAAEFDGA